MHQIKLFVVNMSNRMIAEIDRVANASTELIWVMPSLKNCLCTAIFLPNLSDDAVSAFPCDSPHCISLVPMT
jgi:hypothetical protein